MKIRTQWMRKLRSLFGGATAENKHIPPEGMRGQAGLVLRGTGIEVGALHNAFPVPAGAVVRYVDRMPKAQLLQHYPELTPLEDKIIDPDIIDDGEKLSSVPADSQDFVIASHFLEHCENPLATLRNHVRVLKPGGVLLYAVPNSDNPESYDHRRERTSFEHLVADDQQGPEISRRHHYFEWVTHVGNMSDQAQVEIEVDALMAKAYSIHFHVWTPDGFRKFLAQAIAHDALPLTVEFMGDDAYEALAVMRKNPQVS